MIFNKLFFYILFCLGLVYWKEKTNSRSYRPRVDVMLQTDLPGRSNSNTRRSSSPLSVYGCEVRPIVEQSEETTISCIKRSSVTSDDGNEDSDRDSEGNDDEDYQSRKGDDEDIYGDIEDLDVEQDNSHSPLLSEKHEMVADSKGNRSSVYSFQCFYFSSNHNSLVNIIFTHFRFNVKFVFVQS